MDNRDFQLSAPDLMELKQAIKRAAPDIRLFTRHVDYQPGEYETLVHTTYAAGLLTEERAAELLGVDVVEFAGRFQKFISQNPVVWNIWNNNT